MNTLDELWKRGSNMVFNSAHQIIAERNISSRRFLLEELSTTIIEATDDKPHKLKTLYASVFQAWTMTVGQMTSALRIV